MSDIVKRLRKQRAANAAGEPCACWLDALDAADEIERLQAHSIDWFDRANKARADAARLRGALRIIAGYDHCINKLLSNADIARAALNGGSHD